MIGKGRLKPSYTQRPAFFAGVLGMMAAISGTLLAMGFAGTEEPIRQRLLEDLQASLSQVLPAEMHDNDPSRTRVELQLSEAESLSFYLATLANEPVAAAFEVAEEGYSGLIRIVMGVGLDGQVLGVRVLSHTETPGLGDKIEIAKDDWIESFNGMSLEGEDDRRWAVSKDGGQFDQFSGATITPRAVVKAVKKGLLLHRDNQPAFAKQPLLDESATAAPSDPSVGIDSALELNGAAAGISAPVTQVSQASTQAAVAEVSK